MSNLTLSYFFSVIFFSFGVWICGYVSRPQYRARPCQCKFIMNLIQILLMFWASGAWVQYISFYAPLVLSTTSPSVDHPQQPNLGAPSHCSWTPPPSAPLHRSRQCAGVWVAGSGQSSDYTKCPNYTVWSSVLSVHFKVTVAELVLCWYWTCVLADSKLMCIQHWCLNNSWSIDCLNLQPYCLQLWSKKTELMQVLGGADLVAVIFWFTLEFANEDFKQQSLNIFLITKQDQF